jgi:excisionase family DNA binding protein
MNQSTDPKPTAAEAMTYRQVAQALGVNARTIYREVQRGRFPRPIRIGRAVRFRRVDVDAWTARQYK